MTADLLGERMAGPAIRSFEIAKALSAIASVRLVSTNVSTLHRPGLFIEQADEAQLKLHEAWADIVVFQGHMLSSFPWMRDSPKVLVADIYDPMHLEQLEQDLYLEDSLRFSRSVDTVNVLNEQIARADFMLCASEKQRDFWLGQLAAVGRINPDTYANDPSLRSLLDVAPFGLSEDAPVQRERAIKGTVPGIGRDDKVIIWGGGIYNWFDPLTLIHAVALLHKSRPEVRLFFLGAGHPNPAVPAMRVAVRARDLAIELGLLDRVVFFNEEWVAYDRRADFLLDADVGVSTHFDHLETAFSFRTRILDYLWASLPIVSTAGDTFADLIRLNGLGRVVAPEDVEGLADALEEMLCNETERRAAIERVEEFASTMTWAQALRPLLDFCRNPRRADDVTNRRILASQHDLDIVTRRVIGLEGSTSWRLTAPFRRLTELVSRSARRRSG